MRCIVKIRQASRDMLSWVYLVHRRWYNLEAYDLAAFSRETMKPSPIGKAGARENSRVAERTFQLSRHQPAEDLSLFVEHYWIVTWDLRGQKPYTVDLLPHPRIHLVITQDQSGVFGVVKGKFTYIYENTGRVFGVRFKPGAFYPFAQISAAELTNSAIDLLDAFGVESRVLENILRDEADDTTMIEHVEQFLRQRKPVQEGNIGLVQHVFDTISTHREITRVDELMNWLNLNERTVQRLFHHYVGVSPKWVIKHYRLHEVAEHLAEGETVDWSKMALDLGYYDQAHFIKDFKAMVGKAPAKYAQTVGKDSSVYSTCVFLHQT